jgi:hypothetical protein
MVQSGKIMNDRYVSQIPYQKIKGLSRRLQSCRSTRRPGQIKSDLGGTIVKLLFSLLVLALVSTSALADDSRWFQVGGTPHQTFYVDLESFAVSAQSKSVILSAMTTAYPNPQPKSTRLYHVTTRVQSCHQGSGLVLYAYACFGRPGCNPAFENVIFDRAVVSSHDTTVTALEFNMMCAYEKNGKKGVDDLIARIKETENHHTAPAAPSLSPSPPVQASGTARFMLGNYDDVKALEMLYGPYDTSTKTAHWSNLTIPKDVTNNQVQRNSSYCSNRPEGHVRPILSENFEVQGTVKHILVTSTTPTDKVTLKWLCQPIIGITIFQKVADGWRVMSHEPYAQLDLEGLVHGMPPVVELATIGPGRVGLVVREEDAGPDDAVQFNVQSSILVYPIQGDEILGNMLEVGGRNVGAQQERVTLTFLPNTSHEFFDAQLIRTRALDGKLTIAWQQCRRFSGGFYRPVPTSPTDTTPLAVCANHRPNQNDTVVARINGEALPSNLIDVILKRTTQRPRDQLTPGELKTAIQDLVWMKVASSQAIAEGLGSTEPSGSPDAVYDHMLALWNALKAKHAASFVPTEAEYAARVREIDASTPKIQYNSDFLYVRKEALVPSVSRRLADGESMESIAASGHGGDLDLTKLGWLDSRTVSKKTYDEIVKLKKGEESNHPIYEPSGPYWIFVRVNDVRILPPDIPDPDSRKVILNTLERLKIEAYLDNLVKAASVDFVK